MTTGKMGQNLAIASTGAASIAGGLVAAESVVNITKHIPEHEQFSYGIAGAIAFLAFAALTRAIWKTREFSRETAIRSV